ncbi:MAG: PQQ-binding-like beta-propeller repeat protein [Kiritimatiellales bacterium]|nr:PQQ-binding-like beta-propeller repeat protein [Kiritimatiellales bacterium]
MRKSLVAVLLVLVAAFSVDAATAVDILKATGVKGGLVVHVGCGDGTLTADFRANNSFKVHGLDASEANVQKARAYLNAKGIYGQVAVTRMDGGKIPFIDNFATLVVVSDAKATTQAEILRVLAPGGKVWINGKVATKPLSKDRDEWTHYLHDASNNAVSTDKLVAPPKHMQFRAGLEWSRLHHKLASVSGVVTAKGRMFYVKDSGPGGDMSVPARWSVLARDAYNSTFLWERNIDSWSDYSRGFRAGPAQLPRLLVTDGHALYLPLGIDQPVNALDAATGKTLHSFKGSEGTEELILHRGMLLVVVGSPSPAQAQNLPGYQATTGRKVLAFNAATGAAAWQTPEIPVADLTAATLATDDTQVYFQGQNGVTCLNLKTGKQIWGPGSSSSKSSATSSASASGGPVKGRYIHVRSGGNGSLALAEVQVFSGGQNIAMAGSASQTSQISEKGKASNAIDGNTDGDYHKGSISHTHKDDPADAWELDLGKTAAIEKISVWNRSTTIERLDGSEVFILDDQRKSVWSGMLAKTTKGENVLPVRAGAGTIGEAVGPITASTLVKGNSGKAKKGGKKKKSETASADKKDKKKKSKKSKGGGLVSPGASTLVVKDGVVLSLDGKTLTAYDAKDGTELWNSADPGGFRSPGDIFVINGQVWLGNTFTQALDLRTGKVVRETTVLKDIQTLGHHHRCYREKATEHYIMAGHRGIEYMDLQGNDHARNNWIRGLCQYGVMPANGLTYAPPHACGCYMEAKLYGFWAVSAQREGFKIDNTNNPLEKGPAYGKTKGQTGKADWPTLRGDIQRSGTTAMKLSAKLSKGWKTKLGTRLTPPVAANGFVLVADKDTHTVFAVDAASGKVKWSYIAGGPIDSPPTIHNGAAIFGCHDGWVYCLRLTDGALAWRFRAAPADYLSMNMDQVESVWPVFGSVLVQNGLVYCAAGHNSYLDGGIFMYALDPATGKVAHRERFDSERPEIFTTPDQKAELESKFPATKLTQNATDYRTFASPDKSDSFSINGATMNDVVSGDGKNIFLHHLTYGTDWKLQEEKKLHLFSTSNLVDDNENHRSHWAIGRGHFDRTPVAYPWIPERSTGALLYPIGLMFAVDNMESWGIERLNTKGDPGKDNYALFRKTIPKPSSDHLNDLIKSTGESNWGGGGKEKTTWQWNVNPEIRPRAILKAGDSIVLGGMPLKDESDPFATFEGRKGGVVKIFSAEDGKVTGEIKTASPIMWDGFAAANGKLYASLQDGSIICLK